MKRAGAITGSRKGYFFTIDAIIASAIIISIILVSTNYYVEESTSADVNYLSNDLIVLLSELTVSEFSSTFVDELIAKGNITGDDFNNSVLEQIGRFWAEGKDELAENLTREVVELIMPQGYSYGLWIDQNETYNITKSDVHMLFSYKRMISGIERDKPVEGFSSTIYLDSIKNRLTSSFAYFGGFVGEGNITHRIELPANFSNTSNIREVVLEVDSGTDFLLRINGQDAGTYPKGSGGGQYMVPERWIVNSSYHSLFHNGTNNFSILFTKLSENFTASGPKYIGGGYFKVTYFSDEISELGTYYISEDKASKRYWFPGIDGFINLYSSVFIPGAVNSISARLHFNSTYEIFLKMGNVTIYSSETNGTVVINISNSTIVQAFNSSGINFWNIGLMSLPLRLGFEEVSKGIAPTDIALVSDVSGSMSADYMQGLSGGRMEGNSLLIEDTGSASAGSSYTFTFNLSEVSFSYDSLDVRGVGNSGGNVDVYVTPPGGSETRAQCDESPNPCSGVDSDNDEYYYSSSPAEGLWTVRIYSSISQDVTGYVYISKIDALRNAADNFVESMLDYSGARVGLVSYESSVDSTHNLSYNATELKEEIDAYSAGGGTCICCGILEGISILNPENTSLVISRKATGWKYNEMDLSSPPSGWNQLGFDDSSWSAGTAVFRNNYWWLGSPSTTLTLYEGDYYFRKNFTISDSSAISDAKVYILSDNGADVYLNGNLVDGNYGEHAEMEGNAEYWDRDSIDVSNAFFQDGENVVAARMYNREACEWRWVWVGPRWWNWEWQYVCWSTDAAFDLELLIGWEDDVSGAKQRSMIVMSDGEANEHCSMDPVPDHDGDSDTSNDPQDHAIEAACRAYDDYGIKVYSVGFGESFDEETMRGIAECGSGRYYNSSSVDELDEVYEQIGDEVISYSISQLANTSGVERSRLFTDSYIEFNFTPIISPPQYGKIPLTIEGSEFGNNQSSTILSLPSSVSLSELKASSYSADKWSAYMSIANPSQSEVFSLGSYGQNFQILGDPFILDLPVNLFAYDTDNNITVTTGFAPQNLTGGSEKNRLLYSVRVDRFISPGGVFKEVEGCNWSFELEDGTSREILIPGDYNSSGMCYYNSSSHEYNASVASLDDGLQYGAFKVFELFDFDDDGRVSIDLVESNLNISSITQSGVPSMWGPAITEVRIWK